MANLSELRVFITAAEELNFSRAARRLHLSQSAVSQNIQSFERSYGVELFVRQGRSVQLSETGHAILPIVREILNSARILEDILLNAQGEVSGELSIGCAISCGRYFVPSMLASFQSEYPHIHTRIIQADRSQVLEGVSTRTFDLGILGRKTEHRDLESQLLFKDQIILIVSARHPWVNRKQINPQELLNQSFISREDSSGTYHILFEQLQKHGIEPENLNVVTELGEGEAVEMAVEKGIGIAFIPEIMATRSLALGRVKKVPVAGFNPIQQVYLTRRKSETFTKAESLFWDFVQQNHEALTTDLLHNLTNVIPS